MMSHITRNRHHAVTALGLAAAAFTFADSEASDGACSINESSLEISCPDYSMKLFGRLHVDALALAAEDSPVSGVKSWIDLRRVRFGFQGRLKGARYKLQTDVSNQKVSVKDAYIAMNVARGLTVRVGNFKAPFSIEQLSSSKYGLFLERGINSDDRMVGVGAQYELPFGLAALAVHGDDIGSANFDNDYGVSGRINYAMVRERFYLHIGVGGRYLNFSGPTAFSYKSTSPFTKAVLSGASYDAGVVNADSMFQLNPEMSLGYGPFGFQAEYALRDVQATGTSAACGGSITVPARCPDRRFSSWYVQANAWLTGESNAYKIGKGAFGNVHPRSSLDEGGIGAVAVAVRYASFDFDDAAPDVDGLTATVTWKPYPNFALLTEFATLFYDDDADGDNPYGVQFRANLFW